MTELQLSRLKHLILEKTVDLNLQHFNKLQTVADLQDKLKILDKGSLKTHGRES